MSTTFDYLVVGTGPSSEPVIYHLSKTPFSVAIVDASDLFSYQKVNHEDYSPVYMQPDNLITSAKKTNLNLAISPKLYDNRITNNTLHGDPESSTNKNFIALFSTLMSGGLTNFWGGGYAEWPNEQLRLLTSFSVGDFLKAYYDIGKRVSLQTITNFASQNSPVFHELMRVRDVSRDIGRDNIKIHPANYMTSLTSKQVDFSETSQFNQSSIWNSAENIRAYAKNSINLNYLPKLKVLSIANIDGRWIAYCLDLDSQGIHKIEARFICLAAGTVESTRIALTALKSSLKFKIDFKNNSTSILPAFSKKMNFISSINQNYPSIPELQWSSLFSPHDSCSGYILTAQFIIESLKNSTLGTLLNPISSRLLHNMVFVTAYLSSHLSTASLYFEKCNSTLINTDLVSVDILNSSSFSHKRFRPHLTRLCKKLKRDVLIHPCLMREVSNGGDVHYASTFKSNNIDMNYPLHIDIFGEVMELPGIYICDPSKLQFLSSLPHTFTTMAMTDLSMPQIISKAYEK